MDGTHCKFGHSGPYDVEWHPFVGIDPTSGDLWAVGENLILHCNKHIANCTVVLDMNDTLLQGATDQSRVLVDGTRGRAYVVVGDARNETSTPGLVRGDFGGTGCDYCNISAGRGPGSGDQITAALDERTGNVLVVTSDGSEPNVGLLSLYTGTRRRGAVARRRRRHGGGAHARRPAARPRLRVQCRATSARGMMAARCGRRSWARRAAAVLLHWSPRARLHGAPSVRAALAHALSLAPAGSMGSARAMD
jgi:hypothetical protein